MASEGGGKLKQKKDQTPNKPYSRNPSLFGKLRESVKDLLIPSWLTGSPTTTVKQEEAGNVSATHLAAREAATSSGRVGSVAHEWPQGSTFQPERLGPGPVSAQYGNSTTGKLHASNIPGFGLQTPNGEVPSDQSPFCVGPAPNMTIGSAVPPVSTSNKGRSFTKSSDRITGLQRDGQRQSGSYEVDSQEFPGTPFRPIMISTGVKSTTIKPEVKRQRLWSPDSIRQGKPFASAARGKPSFNSLLFSTPSKGDSSMSGSFGESSFYVGKTCYGGASAKKKLLNTSSPYLSSLPLRKQQVKAKRLNSSLNATTSSTAQRILDTLERMSTPLEDAKKIPQADQSNESVLSFTPSSYRRQSSQCSVRPITRPLQLPNRGPPTSQLQSTSQIGIAKNRDRSRPSESGLSITQESVSTKDIVDSSTAASGLKMKSKKFSQHMKMQQEEEVFSGPNLRTDFTLPVSNIAPIVLSSTNDKFYPAKTAMTVSSSALGGISSTEFTFSTPIEERNRPSGSQVGGLKEQGFQFSSPIHVSANKTSAAGAECGSKSSPEPAVGAATPSTSTWTPQTMKPKALSPDIGGTSSSFKSYTKWSGTQKNEASDAPSAFGSMPGPSSTLKKGSVMDILGGGKSATADSQSSNAPLGVLFKKTSGSWECDTCLVQNTTSDKCVACTTPKPGSKPVKQVNEVSHDKPSLSSLFKKQDGSWECDTCMVQNNSSVNKCVACTTPKPGSKSGPSGAVPLSEMFKKTDNAWDCDVCMVQNMSMAIRCVACETPKPGAMPGKANVVPLGEMFKKPDNAWDCDTCMVQNTSMAVKCVACETPKPGGAKPGMSSNSLGVMFKKPEGSWDCDTCMVQNSSTALRCIACDSSKPGLKSAGIVSKPTSDSNSIAISPSGGFSFNLPSTTATTTGSAGFMFGNTPASVVSSAPSSTGGFSFGLNNASQGNKVSVNSADNKISPSGGFQFGTVSNTSSHDSSGGFKFGTPVTSSNASDDKIVSSGSVSKPAGLYQFGATACSSAASTSTTGFAFGDTSQKINSAIGQTASIAPVSSSIVSPPSSLSSSPSDSVNKSNVAAVTGFQFGSPSTRPAAVPVDKKSEQIVASQPTFTFGATSANTSKSPFVFGAPVSSVSSNSGALGTGHSLTTSAIPAAPLVNGGFGARLATSNSGGALGAGHTLATSAPAAPHVNGGFGRNSSLNSNPGGAVFGAKPISSQNSGTTKRSIDNAELEAPSAKIVPVFGSSRKEPAVNGFNFNAGQSQSFVFGASQPSQQPGNNGTAGGFSFSAAGPVSQPTSSAGGFSFSSKATSGPESQGVKSNEVSFSVKPDFNFAAPGNGTNLFQFGSKPEAAPSANLFAFGASNPSMSQPNNSSAPVFGSVAQSPTGMGGFNMGSADTSQRKMKKAVRRIRQPR